MPAEAPSETKYFGREIDYLEDLGAKLRNLKGFATLANELLQNADDVQGVTLCRFNVCDDALIVENDGQFSDCGKLELPECPWKEDPEHDSHRCDFHRFRKVAGADKRNEEDTTGAFGIGFISVYQITDRPEVVSGRHWILDELEEPSKRISQCGGCDQCRDTSVPTRFYLPWASDPDSELRKKLRTETTDDHTAEDVMAELQESLSTAMLFLKKVSKVEILKNGELIRCIERVEENGSILLSDGEACNDETWHLFQGDFKSKSDDLCIEHGSLIEGKRKSEVTIAICAEHLAKGLICVTLPTQQSTGLPFHVNGDFFPSEDRKRIILEDDYQSDWNRAILHCAAEVFGSSLNQLPSIVKPVRLWEMIDAVKSVSGSQTDSSFSEFWQILQSNILNGEIVATAANKWKAVDSVFYLQQEAEHEAESLFESLGLDVVHSALRPFQNLLISKDVGVKFLTAEVLAQALELAGLNQVYEEGEWPGYIRDLDGLKVLWAEVDRLLSRRKKSQTKEESDSIWTVISRLSLVIRMDGALAPCSNVFGGVSKKTGELFEPFDSEFSYVSRDVDVFESRPDLCPVFGPDEAVHILVTAGDDKCVRLFQEEKVSFQALIGWFEHQRNQVLENQELKQSVAALPIYPTAGTFRPLTELSLPGDFDDPLQMASVLDVTGLSNAQDFLKALGVQELTLSVYVSRHLVPALVREKLPPQKIRDAVILLARRRSEIIEADGVVDALSNAKLVECRDGNFYAPVEVYFENDEVSRVLGGGVALALMPLEHAEVYTEFLDWVGVTGVPRFSDVLEHIKALVEEPPAPMSTRRIQSIFEHLARCVHKEGAVARMDTLKSIAWLPGSKERGRWHKPEDLRAVFRSYLFESQAVFLAVDRAIQNGAVTLLGYLGISAEPTPEQVVGHLIASVQQGTPVNQEVYSYLNNNAEDPSVLQLRDQACLLLPNGQYVRPDAVFWLEHEFGRYRWQLGSELRKYDSIFGRLGIKESPSWDDAVKVLHEISDKFGVSNQLLDEEVLSVLMVCWKMIEGALLSEEMDADNLSELRSLKCIPNKQHLLMLPDSIFFEDRAGLAVKFKGFLEQHAISRPLGACQAMTAAGARPLAQIVELNLLECQNPKEDEGMCNLIRERRLQLARVFFSHWSDEILASKLDLLESIRFEMAENLRVSYQIRAFGQKVVSDPEDCLVLYRPDENLMLYVAKEGNAPWTTMARELSRVIDPELESGSTAAGIKEVLIARSVGEADAVLSELGFPIVEAHESSNNGEPELVKGLGGSVDPGQSGPISDTGSEEDDTVGDSTGEDESPDLKGGDAPEGLKGNGGGESPGGPGSGRGSAGGGGGKGAGGNKRPRRRGKLRSYVVHDPEPDEGESDSEGQKHRLAVDRAGVDKVLEHERDLGCVPEEQEHFNKGFDVISRDPDGQILRYIEVKSLSGSWGGDGVKISPTQFSFGQEKGEKFWLYVVERAFDEDYKIHCIQNPSLRVDEFCFDDGWQDAAEKDQRNMMPEEEY